MSQKKIIILSTVIFFLLIHVKIVSAHQAPFAYYTGTFTYDATTHLLTFPFSNINMVQYIDNTFDYFTDPVIGAQFVIGNLYNSDANSLVFGASPGSTDPVSFAVVEGGTTYISGLLGDVVITPVGTSGAKLEFGRIYNVTINNSSGSRFLEEIGSNDLSLFISFTFTSGSNDFTEDASGNISGQLGVVPEPVSSILFLTGGAIFSLRKILKKII